MKKEEVQSTAFLIIAHAGSAFDYFYKAIEYARQGDFAKVDESLKLGSEDLVKAHRAQADLLTAEVNQDDIPFSLLMTHAQDHLTMAIFTQRMANEFILLYKDKYLEDEG